jgi:hypothetical protein
MNDVLKRRFAELDTQAANIEASKKNEYSAMTERTQLNVEYNDVLGWHVKVQNLLEKICGKESTYLKEFEDAQGGMGSNTFQRFKRMRAVFEAAREDFEGGYLVSMRTLVQAEVFDSELDQVKELLKSAYATPAAVIAGAVLETYLRELCDRNGISYGKLDKMNADLTKAGIYNGIVQKRITHLAAVRNSAAHGNKAEFEQYDVAARIDEVERFVAQHLN